MKKPNFLNSEFLNKISADLCDALPSSVKTMKKDVEKNFLAVLQATFSKLDLVTREEFDVQTKVLARSRKRIEELEQKISHLEQLTAKKHAKK